MKRYEAYIFLCDCLSLDFHSEKLQEIKSQLNSGKLNWRKIITMASKHLVIQTLYRIFKENQLLDTIPEEVVSEMKKIYSLVEVRNQEMLEQCAEINLILTGIEVQAIFTKGIGYIMQGLYKNNADRLSADVDILIGYNSLEPAVKALKENGYTHLEDLNPKQIPKLKHFPRIFKPGSRISFELHWEPINPKYRDMLTEKMVTADKIPAVNFPGAYTMSWNHTIQHSFIHAQLEHRAHANAKVILRNMYDLALLSKKANIGEVLEALNGYQKQAASYIVLTEKTFNLKNLSSPSIRDKASRFFLHYHKLNLHYGFISLIIRFLRRIYLSYIRKFFRAFFDKELRNLIFKQLSSKSWYKHHLNTYRKMFRGPRIDENK